MQITAEAATAQLRNCRETARSLCKHHVMVC